MKKINAVLASIIDALQNVTIESTTESRSSHGRTQATTTTRIRREAQTAETTKTTTEDPWLVEADGWKPAESRRSDGCRELWGKPRVHHDGNISVPVKIVDGDITVNEYILALTITVRDQVEHCQKEAVLDIIRGRSPWIPLDIQRCRKLLSHHEGKAWEQIRSHINGLYNELNEIAAAAAAKR